MLSIRIVDGEDYRTITADGLPDHETGRFPNRGNPSQIQKQAYTFRLPRQPTARERAMPVRPSTLFAVGVNGVVFDPSTGEFWNGRREWRYEALTGKMELGIDQNNAHVQPNGAYHYHGLPTGLIEKLVEARKTPLKDRMLLVAWAADGFPVYARYAHEDAKDAKSKPRPMKPSFRVKDGARPGGDDGPGGRYDGTFGADWEYAKGSGDLDECNGRFGVTPEFPDGTYYYVLTDQYPFVPRFFRGTPDASFNKTDGPPPGGGRGGPGEREGAGEHHRPGPRPPPPPR